MLCRAVLALTLLAAPALAIEVLLQVGGRIRALGARQGHALDRRLANV